ELGMTAVDPVNKFSSQACVYASGKCLRGSVETGALCSSDRDCISETCPGCVCQPSLDSLYNQSTCYNASTMSFDEEQAFFNQPDSYVYRYEVLDGGANYKLDYHLEYLKHVQFSSEGTSESDLMGVGQCYAGGTWWNEGDEHPSQDFTFCRLGRWVNSCGNGIVDTELGEDCESSVNMCNEKFGNQNWYTSQTKTCSNCLWQGVCSNIPSKTCVDSPDCRQSYSMAKCESHPLISSVSVCSGAGVNNGKLCTTDEDCQQTKGECLGFEDSFSIGRCQIKSSDSGSWVSDIACVENGVCSDFYKYYYCQVESPIACIKDNVKQLVDIDQNNLTESCEKCAINTGGVCLPEKHCVNYLGESQDQSFFCSDSQQCLDKFGKEYGSCMATSDGSIAGTCYTQNNENTGMKCFMAKDCFNTLSVDCSLLGGAGFDEADCGGYCGDGTIQSSREVCDWKHPDYYSSNNPDQNKIYCSNTCSSSCPSGTNKNVFYQGDSYFLRRYCVGTGDSNVDGQSCVANDDCRATVGGVERQGTCQLDTLYALDFEAADGFPSGVNLYLPPCNRLAQGSWTCQSTNAAYLKDGAWCHPDYDEHCVDKNGVVGTCTEAFSGKEPPGFMADITLNNLQAPTLNVVFVIDKSSSMNTYDVSCGDPKNNSGTQKICEVYPTPSTRLVYSCINGQPAAQCVAAGVSECKVRDSRFECALDALTNSTTGAIQKLVDFATANGVNINMSAVFFSSAIPAKPSTVPASGEELTWYNSSSVNSFKTFLSGQVTGGSTYTDDGFEVAATAIALKENILAESDKVSDSILILLTDGDVDVSHKAEAIAAASKMKESGVSLYTIAYPQAITNTYLWSSECPADELMIEPNYSTSVNPHCVSEPAYAYSSAANLNVIYDEIISRMTVTLTANALSAQLYGGRYMPLPGTYRCSNEAQLLPLNINVSQSLRGNIKLQNLKFNYCP
ncbi:MAG TPA: vWA domain-containing protein, partial [bacterium]|nr:vWA domain-containing protein [bacterium]